MKFLLRQTDHTDRSIGGLNYGNENYDKDDAEHIS